MNKLLALIISCAVLYGCQSSGISKTASGPPDWVEKVPVMKGMVCSVGMSDPTFFEEDSKINASEIARRGLAKTLSVDLNSIMVDLAMEKGDIVEEAVVMQVSSWASTAVVKNAEVLEYWRDVRGIVSERRNSMYALACMPRKFDRNSLETELVNSAGPGSSNLQEIGRTADEIIDKLEGFE